jgi:hypothetical protein
VSVARRVLLSDDPALSGLADDPLRDRTQAQHRNVLIVSSLAILIAQLNLAPKRISAVGVDLQSDDRNYILVALLVAVAYLLVAFLLPAIADYTAWSAARRAAAKMRSQVKDALTDAERQQHERWDQQLALDPDKRTSTWSEYENLQENVRSWKERERVYATLTPISHFRTFLDFGLPVLLALWAIGELVFRLT